MISKAHKEVPRAETGTLIQTESTGICSSILDPIGKFFGSVVVGYMPTSKSILVDLNMIKMLKVDVVEDTYRNLCVYGSLLQ